MTEHNEVKFTGKVREIEPFAAGDRRFVIVDPNGRTSNFHTEHMLRERGLPVPERTTAVTVHLTDEEMEAWTGNWDAHGWGELAHRNALLRKVGDAIRAQREADQ